MRIISDDAKEFRGTLTTNGQPNDLGYPLYAQIDTVEILDTEWDEIIDSYEERLVDEADEADEADLDKPLTLFAQHLRELISLKGEGG